MIKYSMYIVYRCLSYMQYHNMYTLYTHHRLTFSLAFLLFVVSGIRMWGGNASSRCSRSRLWRSRSSCFLAIPTRISRSLRTSSHNIKRYHHTASYSESYSVNQPHTSTHPLQCVIVCAHIDVLFIFTEQSCTMLGRWRHSTVQHCGLMLKTELSLAFPFKSN